MEGATVLRDGHFKRQIDTPLSRDHVWRQRRRSALIIFAMAAGAFALGFIVPVNP
jgi:hypothetical protein